MRKPQSETLPVADEQSALEIIELASDELQSLTKVFNMLNALCSELADEVARESREELEIH